MSGRVWVGGGGAPVPSRLSSRRSRKNDRRYYFDRGVRGRSEGADGPGVPRGDVVPGGTSRTQNDYDSQPRRSPNTKRYRCTGRTQNWLETRATHPDCNNKVPIKYCEGDNNVKNGARETSKGRPAHRKDTPSGRRRHTKCRDPGNVGRRPVQATRPVPGSNVSESHPLGPSPLCTSGHLLLRPSPGPSSRPLRPRKRTPRPVYRGPEGTTLLSSVGHPLLVGRPFFGTRRRGCFWDLISEVRTDQRSARLGRGVRASCTGRRRGGPSMRSASDTSVSSLPKDNGSKIILNHFHIRINFKITINTIGDRGC